MKLTMPEVVLLTMVIVGRLGMLGSATFNLEGTISP
jgi:hypothetical protein